MSEEKSDKITYSENRTINVGQYENVHMYFSYTGNVKHFNRIDSTVEISYSESQPIADAQKDFEDTARLLMKRVKKVLNTRERELRLASMDFVVDPYLELKASNPPEVKDCL